MSQQLDREDVKRIRDLAEALIEDKSWGALDMDLRWILADAGLPETDRAEREMRDHMVWLLS